MQGMIQVIVVRKGPQKMITLQPGNIYLLWSRFLNDFLGDNTITL